MFPFLKMVEYLCNNKDLILKSDEQFFSSGEFYESDIFNTIVKRSFRLGFDDINRIQYIFKTGAIDYNVQKSLAKVGVWNSETNSFISDFFIAWYLYNHKNVNTNSEYYFVEQVIKLGLSELSSDSLSQPDLKGGTCTRIERSICYYIADCIARGSKLYISPEHKIVKKDISSAGCPPCVDFYINGKLDMFLEVIRNGNETEVKNHFESVVT